MIRGLEFEKTVWLYMVSHCPDVVEQSKGYFLQRRL